MKKQVYWKHNFSRFRSSSNLRYYFIILPVCEGRASRRWAPAEICMLVYDQMPKRMQLIQLLFCHPCSTQAIVKHVDMNWNSNRFPRSCLFLATWAGNPATGCQLGAALMFLFQHVHQRLYPNWPSMSSRRQCKSQCSWVLFSFT